jgi:hypothetical protein
MGELTQNGYGMAQDFGAWLRSRYTQEMEFLSPSFKVCMEGVTNCRFALMCVHVCVCVHVRVCVCMCVCVCVCMRGPCMCKKRAAKLFLSFPTTCG